MVRAATCAANPTATVRDVAADWSFWHFSQFASDYRKLFGLQPLRQARAPEPALRQPA